MPALFVRGVHENVTEDLLHELFFQVVPLEKVRLAVDPLTAKCKGYGFVHVATREMADYAIKTLNGIALYGAPIVVDYSRGQSEGEELPSQYLRVSNVSAAAQAKLPAILGNFGKVLSILHHEDYSLVYLDSEEAMAVAAQALNGQFVAGSPITVALV